jgi:hypothetical protein
MVLDMGLKKIFDFLTLITIICFVNKLKNFTKQFTLKVVAYLNVLN